MTQPSLEALKRHDVRQSMNRHRPRLEAEAKAYGIKNYDKLDVFKLAEKVHYLTKRGVLRLKNEHADWASERTGALASYNAA